jgi:hypothetical protein
MLRSFATGCLTVALVFPLAFALALGGSGCASGKKTHRKARPAPAVATSTPAATPAATTTTTTPAPATATTTTTAMAVPPSTSVADRATPDTRGAAGALPAGAKTPLASVAVAPAIITGAGGSSAGTGMAVLILMLPAANDGARGVSGSNVTTGGLPRTYKLTLSANADVATVEVDGRPTTTTPVQRVYPTAPSRLGAIATVVPRARPTGAPSRDRLDLQPPDGAGLQDLRTHQGRRPGPPGFSRTAFDAEPFFPSSPNGAPIIE